MATKKLKNKKTEKENFIEAGKEVVSDRQKIFKKHGLDLSYYCERIKYLCEATKPISCIKGKDADGGTVDFVDVPDNSAIARGVDMGLKLGEHYPKEELKVEVKTDLASIIEEARKRVKKEKP